MAKVKFILDCRAVKEGAVAPLKVQIGHQRQSALMSLNIFITAKQWDAQRELVKDHPNKDKFNQVIARRRVEITDIIAGLLNRPNGIAGMTATEIKYAVQAVLEPKTVKPKAKAEDPNSFVNSYNRFTDKRKGRTREIYQATMRRLIAWKGDEALRKVTFDEINKRWLEDFDEFLMQTSKSVNARGIHFRNIRAAFNDAIDNEITANYPFRRFKIRTEPTRKRNLSLEALHAVFSAQVPKWVEKYRDFFIIEFMLIGINVKDLCLLDTYSDGRVEFRRSKTHKPYSIKVEPELAKLIEKYRGTKHLFNFMDSYADYRSFYANLVKGLREVKKAVNDADNGITLDCLTSYWSRHSWASIAAYLDIPKETIAAALGHSGRTVTDIYINFDKRKVDAANRKVLDFVLHGIKPKGWQD